MRRYLTSILTVIAIIFSITSMLATPVQGNEGNIKLRIVRSGYNEPIEENEEGHKAPSYVMAIISYTGIIIPGVANDDILTYEAFSDSGECVAAFTDEESFVEYFFSTEEISMVRFTTTTYTYTGRL